MISYLIIIEGDGSTNYSAYCPDLPGVAATGESIDECAAESAGKSNSPRRTPAVNASHSARA
jgi:hypothetical protein